jgi:methyl-accepting chemotaxis protein
LNSGEITLLDIPLQAIGREEDVLYAAVYGRGGMLFSHTTQADPKRLERHPDLSKVTSQKSDVVISDDIYDFYLPVRKSDLGYLSGTGQQDIIGFVRIGLSPLRLHHQRQMIVKYYIAASFLLLIIATVISILLAKRFSKPIRTISVTMENVGLRQADLSQRLPKQGDDELARLAGGFNKFCDNLSAIVDNISNQIPLLDSESLNLATSLEQLRVTSREIGMAAHNISRDSQDQLDKITQVSGQINAASESGQDILSFTAEIQKVSDQVSSIAGTGNTEAAQMADKILSVTRAIDSQASAVDQLVINSRTIVGIIKTIEEISHKTDILAINTAIEASRSGNDNGGFNVIASEIRSLASLTMRSAENIEKIVSKLIEDIGTLSENSKKTKSAIGSSRQTLMSASDTLADINLHMTNLTGQIKQIATLQRDNHSLIDQAKQGLQMITGNANKNTAAAFQVSASLQENDSSILRLKEIAAIILDHSKRLKSIVSLFKTKGV